MLFNSGVFALFFAWCESRDGFRVFRLDRMSDFASLDATFAAEPGKTAQDFLKQDAERKKPPRSPVI